MAEINLGRVRGLDGREVLIAKTSTHIVWKYEDESSYKNLVALSDIKGDTGIGIPAGGALGQILTKKSGNSYDFIWVDPGSSNFSVSILDDAANIDNITNSGFYYVFNWA